MPLTDPQVASALAILEREKASLVLSPREQRLQRAIRHLWVTFGAMLLAFVVVTRSPARQGSVLLGLTLYLALAAGALALVMSVLNLQAFRKTWRYVHMIRKLGLSEVSAMRSLVVGRRSRMLATFADAVTAFGALAVGALMIGFRDPLITAIGIVLMGGVMLNQLASRARNRVAALGDVERLEQVLKDSRFQTSEAPASVTEAIAEVAKIERAQITEQRACAISNQTPQTSLEYTILKSTTALAALAKLEVSDRLQVEEALVRLSSAPPGNDAEGAIDVPDTAMTILYCVDHVARQVKILGVQPRPAPTIPGYER